MNQKDTYAPVTDGGRDTWNFGGKRVSLTSETLSVGGESVPLDDVSAVEVSSENSLQPVQLVFQSSVLFTISLTLLSLLVLVTFVMNVSNAAMVSEPIVSVAWPILKEYFFMILGVGFVASVGMYFVYQKLFLELRELGLGDVSELRVSRKTGDDVSVKTTVPHIANEAESELRKSAPSLEW